MWHGMVKTPERAVVRGEEDSAAMRVKIAKKTTSSCKGLAEEHFAHDRPDMAVRETSVVFTNLPAHRVTGADVTAF